MKKAYLGLGSNIDNPINHVVKAIEEISSQIPDSRLIAQSSIYQSKPHGYLNQPDFINAVIEIHTALTPKALLSHCLELENKHERVRDIHWGPRTLDIDILLYDDLCLTDKDLTIPHPRLHERDFVILPLLEIAPQLSFPNGLSLLKLSDSFKSSSMKKLI